ncbi:hypothetical protein [Hydrogenophaga sp.]|uniref:hypothetical protein n=1 Tax=Hydrogenophaga sp. TaxID=1904254 RepID=UPI00271D3D8B|nr:hypothetical protein [Hydrogenophaga sp.]MDO9437776.1 hypothetical protein [Hydrogenophaga sp.]
MKKTFVCTALLLLSVGALAQSLWRDVPAGATVAQVSALIPEAVPAPATAPATAQDERVLLHIPGVELVDAEFTVAFGFEQDKLKSIVLQRQAGTAEQAQAIAQRLTGSLRSRYGLEISTKSRQEPLMAGVDRKWSYRRSSVHLQVLDGTVVRLRYAAEPVRASNQL